MAERTKTAHAEANGHVWPCQGFYDVVHERLVSWLCTCPTNSDGTPLTRVLTRAIADPGALTPRGDNYHEPLVDWQVRAVLLALQQIEVIPVTDEPTTP